MKAGEYGYWQLATFCLRFYVLKNNWNTPITIQIQNTNTNTCTAVYCRGRRGSMVIGSQQNTALCTTMHRNTKYRHKYKYMYCNVLQRKAGEYGYWQLAKYCIMYYNAQKYKIQTQIQIHVLQCIVEEGGGVWLLAASSLRGTKRPPLNTANWTGQPDIFLGEIHGTNTNTNTKKYKYKYKNKYKNKTTKTQYG